MKTLTLLAIPVVVAACEAEDRHFAPKADGGSTASAVDATSTDEAGVGGRLRRCCGREDALLRSGLR